MTIIMPNPSPNSPIRRPIDPRPPIIDCFPQHGPIIKLDQDRLELGKRDKDRDGVLTRDEFGTSKTHSRYFADYDLNKDGKLSYNEFNNGRDFDRMNGGNHLTGDDHLTSDEYGPGLTKQYEFFRYDANHDGKLTREEFAAGRARDERPILRPWPLPRPTPFPTEPRPLPWPTEPPVIKLEGMVDKVKQALQAQQPEQK